LRLTASAALRAEEPFSQTDHAFRAGRLACRQAEDRDSESQHQVVVSAFARIEGRVARFGVLNPEFLKLARQHFRFGQLVNCNTGDARLHHGPPREPHARP
jgi:hypothetical protein